MKGSTQERCLLPAPNVARHWHKMAIWRCMKGSTQENSHFPVLNVKRIKKKWFEDTWKDPYKRIAIFLFQMWQNIYPKRWFEDTCKYPQSCEVICLPPIVVILLHENMIWVDMKGSIQEGCLLPAPNVTRNLHRKMIWGDMKGSMWVRT